MSCPHIVWALREGKILRQRGEERRCLSAYERLVLMVVAERANGEMICWPSIDLIAEDTGMSRRSVQSALRELHNLKLIRIEERHRKTSIYHVLRPKDAQIHPLFEDAAPAPSQDATPAPHAANASVRVQEVSIEGAGGAPESPRESPIGNPPDSPRARALARAEGWEEFWSDYPRKVGKGIAFKAYVRAVKAAGGDFNEVMDALIEAMDEDRRFLGEPQFIPHPSSWLNAGPWHAPDWKPKPSIYATTMEAGHAD
jgi:hypothetical protein